MKILIQLIILFSPSIAFAQQDSILIPIDKLAFDKIVAFNYNLPGDTSYSNRVSNVVVNGKLHDKLIKPGQKISSKQQQELIQALNDTSSYGGYLAACFEPRLTFIFYKKEKIIGHVDICFECNQLESSIYIPNYNFMLEKGLHGFSQKGITKLFKLCQELNMPYCIPEELFDKK